MKKRFLATLATGLFLVGMAGGAQALTINATDYQIDITNDTMVDTNVYYYNVNLPLYGLDNDQNASSGCY